MRRTRVLLLLALVTLPLLLAACGGSGADENLITGKWEASLEGATIYYDFTEEGRIIVSAGDQSMDVAGYRFDGSVLTIIDAANGTESTTAVSFSENTMTFTDTDGYQLILTRVE